MNKSSIFPACEILVKKNSGDILNTVKEMQIRISMKRIAVLLGIISLFFVAGYGYSHSGGLDKNGGHTNRSTGEYHCHRAPCVSNKPSSSNTTTSSQDKGHTSSLQYSRDQWKHWSDFDGDCMNTRHEMLLAQADGTVNLSPDGCYVSTGTWIDPFTGKTFHRASDLDVDHIIPLKWASDHGGALWSPRQKEAFANDPINLLVVDDGQNQSKGAQGPDEWLPPNQTYRCTYIAQWVEVLAKYSSLRMTTEEQRVFEKQKNSCGI